MPLGEPSDQPSDFKLTTSQKNQLRTIEVGCENQIAMAYLTSEQVGRIVEQKCEEHYQNFLNSFKNTDIINQAIANHDPSLCEKTQSQSKCILKYVDENNEPDACKLLEENTECFRTYALKVKEPTICLQAKNSEECVNGLFVPLGSSVCQIWDGEKKSECHYSYIIQKKMPTFPTYTTLNSPTSFETSNPSLYECAPIANNSFYYYSIASACYHEILNDGLISAQELISLEDEKGNLLICNYPPWYNTQHVNENAADYCVAAKAVYTKNLSLCKEAGVAKTDCYLGYALHHDSFSVEQCELLEEKSKILECTKKVAQRTQNLTICEEIKNKSAQFECETGAKTYADWLDGKAI